MEDLNQSLSESFKSYKLEVAGEELIQKLRKKPIDELIKFAESAFSVNIGGVTAIPGFIKMLIQSYKSYKGFKEYFNLKKYLEFFIRLDETTLKQREKFSEELQQNHEFREKFCASVILITERVSEMEKVKLISNITNARIKGQISNSIYFRIIHIVDNIIWHDLHMIYLSQIHYSRLDELDLEKKSNIDSNYLHALMSNNGLMLVKRNVKFDSKRNRYNRNEKDSYIIEEKKDLTKFGIDFITYSFHNFKYGLPDSYLFRSEPFM